MNVSWLMWLMNGLNGDAAYNYAKQTAGKRITMNIRSGSLVIFLFLFCFEDCIANLHVQWSAPFFSSGGYCSEALSYTQALDAVKFYNFTIIQHGDSWNE